MTEVKKTIVLPPFIEGLDGTGWVIIANTLYIGREFGGETHDLTNEQVAKLLQLPGTFVGEITI